MRSYCGESMFGALLLVVVGGMVMPASIGSYVLFAVQERPAEARLLDQAVRRNAEILAFGMQESLWNMNVEGARALVESVMRDPAVQRVQVLDKPGMPAFVQQLSANACALLIESRAA